MEPREQHLDPPPGTLQVCGAATSSLPPPPTDTDSSLVCSERLSGTPSAPSSSKNPYTPPLAVAQRLIESSKDLLELSVRTGPSSRTMQLAVFHCGLSEADPGVPSGDPRLVARDPVLGRRRRGEARIRSVHEEQAEAAAADGSQGSAGARRPPRPRCTGPGESRRRRRENGGR